jgi:hypothetical protein
MYNSPIISSNASCRTLTLDEQATGAGSTGIYPYNRKGKWRVKKGILMAAFLV